MAWTTLPSPVGPLLVASTEVGVLRVSFGSPERALSALRRRWSAPLQHNPARLGPVVGQLAEYFAGRRPRLNVPVDWRLTDGFPRRALQLLHAKVGPGETVTYGRLAEWLGDRGLARAVGTAMASNPVPVIVACHRVVASGRSLGGYSGGSGVEVKRRLLILEGALPPMLDFDADEH